MSLKKIEEQHPRHKIAEPVDGSHSFCERCERYEDPCDVVKLARAVDELINKYPNKDDGKCPCPCSWCRARRTLKEVAG
jgi:hypothetical protein